MFALNSFVEFGMCGVHSFMRNIDFPMNIGIVPIWNHFKFGMWIEDINLHKCGFVLVILRVAFFFFFLFLVISTFLFSSDPRQMTYSAVDFLFGFLFVCFSLFMIWMFLTIFGFYMIGLHVLIELWIPNV